MIDKGKRASASVCVCGKNGWLKSDTVHRREYFWRLYLVPQTVTENNHLTYQDGPVLYSMHGVEEYYDL